MLYMLQGPPWIQSTIGYFFDGSKLAGFMSQPCALRPSGAVNHSGSAPASVTPESTSALTSTSTRMSAGLDIEKATSCPGSLTFDLMATAWPFFAIDTLVSMCSPTVIGFGLSP